VWVEFYSQLEACKGLASPKRSYSSHLPGTGSLLIHLNLHMYIGCWNERISMCGDMDCLYVYMAGCAWWTRRMFWMACGSVSVPGDKRVFYFTRCITHWPFVSWGRLKEKSDKNVWKPPTSSHGFIFLFIEHGKENSCFTAFCVFWVWILNGGFTLLS